MAKIILATRKSPLALAQSEMVAAHLRTTLGVEAELLKMVTTGDRQVEWSLEQKGGKGLFTSELEQALLRGEADVAVHSTKDLPGEMPAGLAMAGYMPREDTRDVLVIRAGLTAPAKIATGSPRRRLQIATVLAAAGMKRLGIKGWPGLEFRPLYFTQMVPAVGQGAIAIQCRAGDTARFATAFDAPTARGLGLERALQNALGGGCHTAFGAHAAGDTLHFFHEQTGLRSLPISPADLDDPVPAAARFLKLRGLK